MPTKSMSGSTSSPLIAASFSTFAASLSGSLSLVATLIAAPTSTYVPVLFTSVGISGTTTNVITSLYVPASSASANVPLSAANVSTALLALLGSTSSQVNAPLVTIAGAALYVTLSNSLLLSAPTLYSSAITYPVAPTADATVLAEVAYVGTTMFVATVTASGRLRLYWWNGAEYAPIVLKYFNGTEWVRDTRTKMFDTGLGTYRLINEP